jgi:hypothetical protein
MRQKIPFFEMPSWLFGKENLAELAMEKEKFGRAENI